MSKLTQNEISETIVDEIISEEDIEFFHKEKTGSERERYYLYGDCLTPGLEYSEKMLDLNDLSRAVDFKENFMIMLDGFPEINTLQVSTQEQLDKIYKDSKDQIEAIHFSTNWDEKASEKFDLSSFENVKTLGFHSFDGMCCSEIIYPPKAKVMVVSQSQIDIPLPEDMLLIMRCGNNVDEGNYIAGLNFANAEIDTKHKFGKVFDDYVVPSHKEQDLEKCVEMISLTVNDCGYVDDIEKSTGDNLANKVRMKAAKHYMSDEIALGMQSGITRAAPVTEYEKKLVSKDSVDACKKAFEQAKAKRLAEKASMR